ncbi:MAG: DUF3515 domain-containing protein [Corynebacteriales bacterium]|nr:DUF3515 domain-containing protein [Mycobacteriales bacterium]
MARSPATLATLVAVPLALIAGIVVYLNLREESSAEKPTTESTAAISVPSPAANSACAPIVDALPATLHEKNRRLVRPRQAQVVAWGDPAIVLRCGVDKPSAWTPTAQIIGVNGIEWVTETTEDGTIWTTVSLPVFVEITVPTAYTETAASHILNPLAQPLRAS